ncbi:MAG: hypothetical protein JNK47_23510 [Mesorhizobium sp.]|nr:hypothetical protein [Mesorhizobium sp.]MBL8580177.1 hypothetical protein [Mesorhizobium sp.]
MTVLFGIPIPSVDPIFLSIVVFHILVGLPTVIVGAVAMLSRKGSLRHSRFGSLYFWLLSILFISATVLAAMRWEHDYHLFILGVLSFSAAVFGRTAARRRWPQWPRLHLSGMGGSYILMLTAFLVDNGQFLPVWRDLPHLTLWFVPSVLGLPFLMNALIRHPLVIDYGRQTSSYRPSN